MHAHNATTHNQSNSNESNNFTMPPKFPHGLTKDPTIMSRAELGVFCVLMGSIGIGVFQLVTSPWAEPREATTPGRTLPHQLETQKEQRPQQ
jgi:hypothetical protein